MRHRDDLPTGNKPAPGDLAFVQGFVNTVDLESGRDALATPAEVGRWLEHHGLVAPSTPVGAAERERVIAFREALRALLRSHHGQPLEAAARAALEAAAVPLRLHFPAAGGGRLEPVGDGVDGALGRLQAILYRAMAEGHWDRLKVCLNDTCQWAFYDASRNRSGTWCTMEVCGNRMKVRAHRRRQSGEDEPEDESRGAPESAPDGATT